MGHAGWAAGVADICLPGEGPDTVLALRCRDTNIVLFRNVCLDGPPVSS